MGSNLGTGRSDPQFTRHVEDVFSTLDELFEAGDAVEALLAQPGWAHVQRLLDAEVELVDRRLDRGGEPLSRAEYAMAHGRRGGLRAAREAAAAIVRVASERLAEQQAKHEGAAEPVPEGVM